MSRPARMVVIGEPTWHLKEPAEIIAEMGAMVALIAMSPGDPWGLDLPMPVYACLTRPTPPRQSRGYRRHIRKQKAARNG